MMSYPVDLLMFNDINASHQYASSNKLMYLDDDSIASEIAEMSEQLHFLQRGKFGSGGYSYLSIFYPQRLAWRISNRFARRVSAAWEVPRDVLAAALYFPIWSELCTISPYRRVANTIARKIRAGDFHGVVLSLSSRRISCFKYWETSDVGVFFLACKLLRLGFQVQFAMVSTLQRRSIDLSFYRSRLIRAAGVPWRRRIKTPCQNFICEEGVRRTDIIPGPGVELSRLQRGFIRRARDSEGLYNLISLPRQPAKKVPLIRKERGDGFARFHGSLSDNLAYEVLESCWKARATIGWKNAIDLVRRRNLENVYICDHQFFASALIGGAAKLNGAKITLLPHSTNPVHVPFRDPGSFDAVVAATAWSAKRWRAQYPNKIVKICTDFMFRDVQSARRFVVGEPLTVVVFGNSNKHGAFPLGRLKTYERTWAQFARVPPECADKIRIFYKPKPQWNDAGWEYAKSSIGDLSVWLVEERTTHDIEADNLIFVSVTFASSALLEGVARGIPALVITDQEIDNYVSVDSPPVPFVASADVWTTLASLNDKCAYDRLAQAQSEWFATEIMGQTSLTPKIPADEESG